MSRYKLLILTLLIIIAFLVGISHKYNRIVGNCLELVKADCKYAGNGYVQVNNFPAEPKKHQVQGKFKIKDITDEVIMDMNLPNEAVPHGAQYRQKIGGWFPFDDISMPQNFNNINPWGQVFIVDGKEYPNNAKLHISNLSLICFRKSTMSWEMINNPDKIYGCFYKENYEDQSTKKADITYTKNGIIVDINSTNEGRCFHFWTPPIKIFNPEDIIYTTIYCDAWITGDNTEETFVFNCGADYKNLDDNGNGVQIKEVIGGRFKLLENKKRRVYATNLSYDKYFDICNQSIIDSLYKK